MLFDKFVLGTGFSVAALLMTLMSIFNFQQTLLLPNNTIHNNRMDLPSVVKKKSTVRIKQQDVNNNNNTQYCFQFLDKYPMAMGCHKSVYRVKSCHNENDVMILAAHDNGIDIEDGIFLELDLLSRSPAKTVPQVYVHNIQAANTASEDNTTNNNNLRFLIQEMVMDAHAFREEIKKDASLKVISPVARLKIAASGFEGVDQLFNHFPLLITEEEVQRNQNFTTGTTNEPYWPDNNNKHQDASWKYVKLFYRDFGAHQLGIHLKQRRVKFFDIASPFYVLYQDNNHGLGSQIPCQTNDDCMNGLQKRYIAKGLREKKRLDDNNCQITNATTTNWTTASTESTNHTSYCKGLNERTHTFLFSSLFYEMLEPLWKHKHTHLVAQPIQERLQALIQQTQDSQQDERPLPAEVAKELYEMSNELQKRHQSLDVLQEELLSQQPWAMEPWNKTCKNAIGIRQATPFLTKNVIWMDNVELRSTDYEETK
mmetsp:Transcript_7485/g.11399  ORF Transcript_7485/g.11399 Transcript_7485/m.11399 type:complete len:483 (-) Transcript_7485:704-2152(-)|eukprot:CAMPEP_0178906680 /NCGR_PEP_ID=MMETSP0786-20121207/6956_1 /TAXON_ID=186022 /ORGANISM="Thalassionema frauenfeldii, Strain CCMP 1798" /LENGTH=482 /DNA_ID=CAMNT_0020578407 /DNA_START=12 /DNA_END=1460 /DNA_ORIENTATION=+